MEENSQLEEKVIQYLEGDLSQQEKLEFEIEISKDDSLRQLVEEYKVVLDGVDQWNTEKLRTRIQLVNDHLHQSGFFETPKVATVRSLNQGNIRKYLAIAASLLVIVTAIVFYQSFKKKDDRIWIANYNLPEKELSLSLLSNFKDQGFFPGITGTDTLLLAIQFYANSSYNESLLALNSLPMEIKNSNIVQYYFGLNYMGLSNFYLAESIFKKLCETQQFYLNDNSCWRYGLSLLNQNTDQKKLVSVFEQIANSNSIYSDKAKEILIHYQ